jgi:hypothetical protein
MTGDEIGLFNNENILEKNSRMISNDSGFIALPLLF